MNFFQAIFTGSSVLTDALIQALFTRNFLKPLVLKHCKRLDYSLTASEKRKVFYYYPIYTILSCAQMYIALKGRRLTRKETKRLTLVGAMATLCDDLIDENLWTKEQIFNLLSSDLIEEGLPKKAQLLVAMNRELQAFWPLTTDYLQQLKTALEWQALSVKQLDPEITIEEIVHICREKNGHTSLMFATLIDENWDAKEKAFIYQSAIVGQLTNDAFDVYVDDKTELQTYFTKAEKVEKAKTFFLQECSKLHDMVRACNASEKFKRKTINRMCVMHGFALTAIDHLQAAENKYGTPADWKNLPRGEVVTDLEKIRHQWRTLMNMIWLSKL